jgi:hypothetical protein
MLTYAIVMFVIAALGGATLAYMRFVNKNISLPLALFHGVFAATGLILLILGFMRMGGRGVAAALIIFVVAAIGGFILFSFQLRSRPLPIPLVLIHGVAALAAFIILLSCVI